MTIDQGGNVDVPTAGRETTSDSSPAAPVNDLETLHDEETPEDIALVSAAPDVLADSLGEYVKAWMKRIRNGESGALPIILGLILIVIIFQVQQSKFLSAGNIVNLLVQAAFFVTLGLGETFTLILSEIDLSVGFGGASLFGGYGKPVHALLGGVLIAAVVNGLALIGVSTAGEEIATSLVLLAAVTVDSIVRRRGSTT